MIARLNLSLCYYLAFIYKLSTLLSKQYVDFLEATLQREDITSKSSQAVERIRRP